MRASFKDSMDGGRRVVSYIAYHDKKPYVRYREEAYLMYGVQMRVDWIYIDTKGNLPFLEENFRRVRELGFDSVMIPIYWKTIEPEKDRYDFSRLALYYSFLHKYDLTVQWLWFGTDVCGMGYNIPDYLWKTPDEYRRIELKDDPTYYFDFSCTASMEREQKALTAMMQWIAENDAEERCVMIQLNNEVDQGAGSFQENAAEGVVYDDWWKTEESHDRFCWVGGQREAVFRQLSALGDIVHNSAYSVVTRVNVSGAARDIVPELVKDYRDMLAYSGIDIIGVDSYFKTWEPLLADINIVEGNVTHVAENGGYYDSTYNTVNLFAMGAGMLIYCHRDDREHYGMYEPSKNQEWTELEGTPKVRRFNRMLHKVKKPLAEAVAHRRFTAFNGEHLVGPVSVKKDCSGLSLIFLCPGDGIGAAFPTADGSVVLMATQEDSWFAFPDEVEILSAVAGKFDGLNWQGETTAVQEETRIQVNAYEAVKVNFERRRG